MTIFRPFFSHQMGSDSNQLGHWSLSAITLTLSDMIWWCIHLKWLFLPRYVDSAAVRHQSAFRSVWMWWVIAEMSDVNVSKMKRKKKNPEKNDGCDVCRVLFLEFAFPWQRNNKREKGFTFWRVEKPSSYSRNIQSGSSRADSSLQQL